MSTQVMESNGIVSEESNAHHVCPYWVAYTFDNPLRRLMDPAAKRLAPYAKPGMSVLDFGCGFGHYTLGLARLVGETGTVWAVDVQQKMLNKMLKRAKKAKLNHIIRPVLSDADGIGNITPVDFLLAGNSLHETPDPAAQLREFFTLIKPGGCFLLIEPRGHLKEETFAREISLAEKAGFIFVNRDNNKQRYCCCFHKPE